MRFLYVLFFPVGLLMSSSCQSRDLVLWVAKDKVDVHKNPQSTKVAFTMNAGEVCVPGRETIMKNYQYTEVLCKQGYGWVIASTLLFDIIQKPKDSQAN